MKQIPADQLGEIIKSLPDPRTSKCDLWKADILPSFAPFDSPAWGCPITYDVITFKRSPDHETWLLVL